MIRVHLLSEEVQKKEKGVTRCPVCGKEFNITSLTKWGYQVHNRRGKRRLLCSWSCLNKAKEELNKLHYVW